MNPCFIVITGSFVSLCQLSVQSDDSKFVKNFLKLYLFE